METYTFDFWIDREAKSAFHYFWPDTLTLYSAFHKLSMLNDLAIPKITRTRFRRDTKTRRFASRLPEPQDEDKVFRFERVTFVPLTGSENVDYVSLSDGEHQLAQLLGTMCMVSYPNVLFLLDEPESHFNPQWRVKFVSRLLELNTTNGVRKEVSAVSEQDCLLTTHSPFVPSDMPREKIFIFNKTNGKVVVRHPEIETFGTTFDTILEECFDVRPPISKVPLEEIKTLMKSDDSEEVEQGIERFGHSVEKVFLADHLRQLKKEGR
jgi:restriction system-associated AAA family ATPase